MTWFYLSLLCIVGWGFADLFYKKGTDQNDKDSQYKIAIWVGLVLGLCAVALFPLSETLQSDFSIQNFLLSTLKYSPASLCYIISMVIGYAGLRYLEISIVSPVQNASGAFSMVCMVLYFCLVGQTQKIADEVTTLNIIGTVFIVAGVIALAIVEQRLSSKEETLSKENKKYKFGALALLFPILYCLFDTIGTAADGIILDEDTGLGLGEIDVIILYGLTFFVAGIIAWIYLLIKNKKAYNPFAKTEHNKWLAAGFEEIGQIFYVYAMAKNPVLAAPMVASYCILSVILSRIFIKEQLKVSQYACVLSVIIGIVILGMCDGIAEM